MSNQYPYNAPVFPGDPHQLRAWRDGITRYAMWDDVKVGGLNVDKRGANDPTLTNFIGGLYLYAFSAAALNEVFFTVQIPHSVREYQYFLPHIHWSSSSIVPGFQTVRWGLEYTIAEVGGNFTMNRYQDIHGVLQTNGPSPYDVNATHTIYCEDDAGAAYEHQIASFISDGTSSTDGWIPRKPISEGGILTTSEVNKAKLSSQVIGRLFRDGEHANDTHAATAFLIEFDMHFIQDSPGSRLEYQKWKQE